MPRSASTGVYTAPSNSFNPAVTNTTIGSAAWNATQADYVTALAHTASTTQALYPTTGQVQDGGFLWGGTAGGTADALTITLTPAITAYAAGQIFQFIAASTNATATPSININGVGVKTIKRQSGAAIQAGDISAGAVVQVAYNGTDFLLTGVTAGQASSLGVVPYSSRTSNTIFGAADRGYLVDITSGTFTQTFGAASALGSGWWLYLRNSGTGEITLDPNGAETIDGLTTFIMYPGEARLIQCDATALRSLVIEPFIQTYTAGGTWTKPPGYSVFGGFVWGAGGGGGRSGTTFAASGGGGGACVPFSLPAASFGTTETITIGTGGTAQTGSGSGGLGGNSSIGAVVTAYGGGGGGGAAAANHPGGGGGGALGVGSTPSGTGSVQGGHPRMPSQDNTNVGYGGGGCTASDGAGSVYGGGAGNPLGSGNFGSFSVYGGGGGGGVGTGASGNPGGVSNFGGSGGAAGTTVSGTAGSAPGGGGGATRTGTTSGAGGRGEVRIWGLI